MPCSWHVDKNKLLGKLSFGIVYIDMIKQFFLKSTYQIGLVSLNVLLALAIIYQFNTHGDVHLCSYT